MLPWQQKPFAAEIHLFNEEEREEIIKAFVANYYRACSKDDDDEPETNKATTVEEHATMKSVVDAFVALFNTKPEFADEAKAHKFLASAVSETDENIIDKLVQYSDEVVAKGYRDGDQHVRQEESTPQSLLWQLAPFQHTVQLSRGQPMQCMWPFVNHIRFGGESNVLKNGIDLVDLPGLSDANQTRVQNANNHLRDCTHYMIVAEIGRAKDDKFIREHLQRSCKSRGPGRTILVLTHADRIDPSTEVFGSLEQEELLGTLQDELSALERKREDLEDRLAQEDSHSMTLERELRTCRAEYQEKESQRQELRIEMRSAEITEEIRKQYQDLTHDPSPLPVFCVGNEAYKKHQAGYRVNDRNAPALSVEGTRIPALRRYLLLAPGHGKLNDARHQALVQIPTAIKCASLYAHRIHMARKDVIEKIVVEPFAHTDTFVNAAFDWAKGQVETHILAQWRSQERDFSARARDLCKTWARLDTGTKLGLYNRNGHRKGSGAKVKDKSKKKETISWNGELVQMKSKEICKWFENFEGATCSMAKQIRRALNLLFNNMGSDIECEYNATSTRN